MNYVINYLIYNVFLSIIYYKCELRVEFFLKMEFEVLALSVVRPKLKRWTPILTLNSHYN